MLIIEFLCRYFRAIFLCCGMLILAACGSQQEFADDIEITHSTPRSSSPPTATVFNAPPATQAVITDSNPLPQSSSWITTPIPLTPTAQTETSDLVWSNALLRLSYARQYDALHFGLYGRHAEPQSLDSSDILNDNITALGSGPASALVVSFANYANQMAFWTVTDEGQLWKSDLRYHAPKLIFKDEADKYKIENLNFADGQLNLVWLPNDKYLILESLENQAYNLIYDTVSNSVEPWPWNCNRLALSPRTEQPAVWCVSILHETQFAIVEWGGTIWYTDLEPAQEFATYDRNSRALWAWSTDGRRVAYFDPLDPDGRLVILENGNPLMFFSGVAWWLTEDVELSKITVPNKLVQWSENGERLLMWGHGIESDSCPSWTSMSAPGPEDLYRIPCWQVIDTDGWEHVWTISDSVGEEMSRFWQFNDASISSDGQLLALSARIPGAHWTGVVTLSDRQIYWWDTGVSVMRWSGTP
jgi:hypothetical protein